MTTDDDRRMSAARKAELRALAHSFAVMSDDRGLLAAGLDEALDALEAAEAENRVLTEKAVECGRALAAGKVDEYRKRAEAAEAQRDEWEAKARKAVDDAEREHETHNQDLATWAALAERCYPNGVTQDGMVAALDRRLAEAEARAAALEAMAGPGSITTLRRLVLALDARGVVFGDDAVGDELCDAYNEARHSCDQAIALAKEGGRG